MAVLALLDGSIGIARFSMDSKIFITKCYD